MGGMGGMGSGTGGAGGMGGNLINGCDPATAVDDTGMANVDIAFGGANGFAYVPPCIKIKSGATVTWNGSFVSHPLQGGTIKNGIPTPDNNGPIKPTNSGSTVKFGFPQAGVFPFYCAFHGPGGMMGTVFVQ